MTEGNGARSLLRFGVFEMDLATGELRKSGSLMHLSPQPFKVLALLASQPGRLVTREEIRQQIWGDSTFVDYEQGLRVAIKKIRAALGDNSQSPRYIETLSRRGYRFIASVSSEVPAEVGLVPERNGLAAHAYKKHIRWGRWALAGAGFVVVASLFFVLKFDGLRTYLTKAVETRPGIPFPRIHSIAVLPFDNLSQGRGQEYFADGMTDELITDLSKINALRVIARTSAMAYQGSKKPLREIARELHVDAVVEGSVQRVGGRVLINVQLVNASTDRNLWAQSYERESKDVLGLQADVAQDIARQIRTKVTPEERRRLREAPTVDPAAHDAYLRGRYLFDQRSGAEAGRSTQYFRQAIRLDPNYASAYAGLAMSLVSQSFLGRARPRDVMPQARAAARHALQLNPQLGEAYTSLGTIEFSYSWDWKAARQDLQRGVQLDPSDAFAEILYTFYLADTGKLPNAVAGAQKAVKLDPVSFFANRNLATMLYFDRRYDSALAQLQRTRELRDVPGVIDNWESWIYDKKHMYDRAVRADLRILTARTPGPDVRFCRAAYARGGWRGYWKARIQRMLPRTAHQSNSAFALAVNYARIGDADDAFRWLNRTVEQRSIWACTLAVNPELDVLHSDPRFQVLLHRLNLSQ